MSAVRGAPAGTPTSPSGKTSSLELLLSGVGDLRVLFQPLFEMRGNRPIVHALEALVRGPRGTRLEAPDALLPFFATRGDGRRLHLLCLKLALRHAERLAGTPRLCLNAGAPVVAQPGFVDRLLEAAAGAKVSTYRLILDITLDDVDFDQASLVAPARELRRHGVRVCLDEGRPFASGFRLLMEAAPEYVKLDRTVVQSLGTNRPHRDCALATVALGRQVGFRVVAEGVESQRDLDAARDCGIDLVQGFHCARPLDPRAPEMEGLLRATEDVWGALNAR